MDRGDASDGGNDAGAAPSLLRATEPSAEDLHRLLDLLHEGLVLGEVVRDARGRPVNWRYRAVNPAWERLTGLAAADALGRLADEVVPGLDRNWIEAPIRAVAEGRAIATSAFASPLGRWYEAKSVPLGGDRFAWLFLETTERHRAETALRASAERLRLAERTADIGTWDLDLATGRGSWDAAALRVGGLPPDRPDCDIESWLVLVHPDDRARLQNAFLASLEPGGPIYDVEFRGAAPAADGGERWLVSHGVTLRDPADGKPLRALGILRDVTEARRAEARLLRSEAEAAARLSELEAIYRTSPVGLATLAPDLRFLRVNDRLAEINGVPAADHLGRPVGEVVPSLLPMVTAILDRIRATGEPVLDVELSGETPAQPGVTRSWLEQWVPLRDARGELSGINVVVEEITRRKRAEQELRESAARLRIALDAGRLGDWTWTAADDSLTFSPLARLIFGLPAEGPLTWSGLQARLDPSDAAVAAQAVREAMATGADYAAEYRVRRPDGSVAWVAARGRPIAGEDGRPAGMIGVVSDVTDRRHAEEQRRLLVGELNHRVKNTLAIVQGIAQQSFRADGIPRGARLAFDGRLAALAAAHNLLTRENWEAADLLEVIRDATRAHGVEDRFDLSGPSVRLGPRLALDMVLALHELCTNAAKHGALSAEEGRVAVSWRTDAPEGRGLDLLWQETGGPAVRAPARQGFGTRMLGRLFAAEPGAEVGLDFRPEGLAFRLRLDIGPS